MKYKKTQKKKNKRMTMFNSIVKRLKDLKKELSYL